jgi:hypothetical protein
MDAKREKTMVAAVTSLPDALSSDETAARALSYGSIHAPVNGR